MKVYASLYYFFPISWIIITYVISTCRQSTCVSKTNLTVTYFPKLYYVVENSCVNFVVRISGLILDTEVMFMIQSYSPSFSLQNMPFFSLHSLLIFMHPSLCCSGRGRSFFWFPPRRIY